MYLSLFPTKNANDKGLKNAIYWIIRSVSQLVTGARGCFLAGSLWGHLWPRKRALRAIRWTSGVFVFQVPRVFKQLKAMPIESSHVSLLGSCDFISLMETNVVIDHQSHLKSLKTRGISWNRLNFQTWTNLSNFYCIFSWRSHLNLAKILDLCSRLAHVTCDLWRLGAFEGLLGLVPLALVGDGMGRIQDT